MFPDVVFCGSVYTQSLSVPLAMPPNIDWDRHSHRMTDEEQLVHFVINMILLILCLALCVFNRLCPRACATPTQTPAQRQMGRHRKFTSVFPNRPPPTRRISI